MKTPTSGKPREMVTTTVAFDRATYKRLRLLSVERDTNVRELIRDAVDDYLKRQHGRKRS